MDACCYSGAVPVVMLVMFIKACLNAWVSSTKLVAQHLTSLAVLVFTLQNIRKAAPCRVDCTHRRLAFGFLRASVPEGQDEKALFAAPLQT